MTPAILAYLPLGLWAAAVLFMGTVDFGATDLPSGADKVAHFILYGVGGGLAAWAGRARRRRDAAWIGLGLVFATGIADEYRQIAIPHRNSDIMDWLADAAGALVVFLVVDRLLNRD